MEEKAVHDAAAIFTSHLVLFRWQGVCHQRWNAAAVQMSVEAPSAIATVRTVSGVDTASWNRLAGILIFLMFIGRVGGRDYDLCSALRQQKQRGGLPQDAHHHGIKEKVHTPEIYFTDRVGSIWPPHRRGAAALGHEVMAVDGNGTASASFTSIVTQRPKSATAPTRNS